MFAYCNNNPSNYSDPSGMCGLCLSNKPSSQFMLSALDGGCGGGGGGVSGAAIDAAVLTAGVVLVAGAVAWEKKEEDLVWADTYVTKLQDSAVYFGADMKGGTWKMVTAAMDFYTAQVWVYTMASIKGYGKGASWGLYTEKEYDAQKMVITLGGPGPCLHTSRLGEYPHFHPMGMILWGQYKHFHVWYGDIYGG